MMESTSRATQADCSNFVTAPEKENVPESSSKEKKILPGRRQQRHSTEIGSEYHRWWVVRNALGFETNEHIAGLLLDGFHGLLQQLVVMCGGEMYQPQTHGESKTSLDTGDNFEDKSTSPTTSSSFSPFSSSPPGVIEDMEEFTEYKNAISHYCNSLWRMCGQHDSRLEELDRASRPVQEFLMRLMGYITAAKGKSYSLNHKKKRFKPSATAIKKPEVNHLETNVNMCQQPPTVTESQFPSPMQAPSLTLLPGANGIFNPSQLTLEQQGWPHNLPASNTVLNKQNSNQKENLEKEIGLSTNYIAGEGITTSTNLSEGVKSLCPREVLDLGVTKTDFQPKLHTTSCGQGHPLLQTFGANLVCDRRLSEPMPQQDYTLFHSQQLSQALSSKGQDVSVSQQNLQHIHQETQTQDFQHRVPQTCYKEQIKEQPRGWDRRAMNEFTGDQIRQYPWHQKNLDVGRVEKLQEQNQISFSHPKQDLQLQRMANQKDQLHGEFQRENQSFDISAHETSWNISDKNLLYSQAKMIASPEETEPVRKDSNCPISCSNSSVLLDLAKEENEEKLRSLLRKPIKILPYQAVKGNPSKIEVSLQQNLPGEIDSYESHHIRNSQEYDKRDSPFTQPALSDKKDAQTNTSKSLPTVYVDAVRSKSGQPQTLPQNTPFNSSSSEMAMINTNTNFYNKIKLNLSNPKQAANVNEVKPNNAQKTVVAKETFPPIQPALFPNPDNASTATTPLGTPVIFYPANSFPSNDNSLASLSSLVHNIVYNSHGTILKPFSLTQVSTAAPSLTTYNQPHLISPPPSLPDNNSQRKPVATALPVLSRQLNSAKPTLVPFYISHTAMNTLSNLSKCASLSEATNIPQVPLNAQNLVQLPQQNQHQYQQRQPLFSSTKLYQDWNLNSNKTTCDWSFTSKAVSSTDVSTRMNQLKITDVRTCSENDFTDISDGRNSENIKKKFTATALDQDKTENFAQTVTHTLPEYETFKDVEGDLNLAPSNSSFQQLDIPYTECRGLSGRKLDNLFCTSNHLGNQGTQTVTSASSVLPQISGYNVSSHFPLTTNLVSGPHPMPLYSKASSQIGNEDLASCHESVTGVKPSKKILTSYLASKPSNCLNTDTNVFKSCDKIKTSNQNALPKATSASNSEPADGPMCPKNQENTSNLPSNEAASIPTTTKKSSSSSHKSSRSRRLLCSICDLVFFSGTDLLVHRYEQHSFVCGECDGRFLSASRLKQHKESDHPHIIVCLYCRFHTYSRDTLVDHVLSEHGVDMNGKDKKGKNKENPNEKEANTKTDMPGAQMRETHVEAHSSEAHLFTSEGQISVESNVSSIEGNKTKANAAIVSKDNHREKLFPRKDSQQTETLEDLGKDELQNSSGSPIYHSKPVSEAQIERTPKSVSREKQESVYFEKDRNHFSIFDLACSGSVFPSFNCKIEGTTQQDLESVSTMYTQVSQHCKLDTVEFLNMSDQQFSENEEPRLVIDTDFLCPRDNESEVKKEKEENTNDSVSYSEQPLCLVTHNRADGDESKTKFKLRKGKKGFVSRSSLGGIKSQNWTRESVVPNEKKEINDTTIGGRGDSLKDILSNKTRSMCSSDGGDEKHVCFGGDGGMDLSLEKLAEREKLVMKFSLKRSGTDTNGHNEQVHKKRRRRKQKGRKRVDFILADPVVEIDNPEMDADPPSYFIINNSLDALPGGKTSDNGHDHIISQSVDSSDIKLDNISNKDLKFDVTEDDGDPGPRRGAAATANMRQPRIAKRLGTPRNNANQRRSGDRFVSPWTHENDRLAREEKMLSLRDRHTMITLPPKKRRLKRPSWSGNEDKSSRAQSKDNVSQLQSGKSASMRKDNQSLKASLRQRVMSNSNNRSNQTARDVRRQGRRTRMTSGSKKLPVDHKGISVDDKKNLKNSVKATVSNSINNTEAVPVTKSTSSSSSSDSTSYVSNQHYICPIVDCKATFTRKWNMDGHIFKVHSKHSQIDCTTAGCDQKFSNRKELRQHITMVHKGKLRKYECRWPECDKSFFARTHLRIHTLMHTGEKPVACQICDYRCRQRTALIWHMRKHGVYHQTGKSQSVVKDNNCVNCQ